MKNTIKIKKKIAIIIDGKIKLCAEFVSIKMVVKLNDLIVTYLQESYLETRQNWQQVHHGECF